MHVPYNQSDSRHDYRAYYHYHHTCFHLPLLFKMDTTVSRSLIRS